MFHPRIDLRIPRNASGLEHLSLHWKHMQESPYPMVPVDEALESVLAQAERLPLEQVALNSAHGRLLAEEIVAATPLPPFRASIKDGYAVVAADGAGERPVIGEVTAGVTPDFRLQPGTVAYITTGAPLPEGADAVVMVEQTTPLAAEGGRRRVRIEKTVCAGDDVRPIGVDIAAGDVVLQAGAMLGAAEIGLLATVGVVAVPAVRRVRVAILSTGDELVEPDQTPVAGQIRDSNRATLAAAVAQSGGDVIDLGISADTQPALEAKIRRGLQEGDILLSSGGVSMGDLDLIKPLLEHTGVVHFGRILMKPGKPLTFATADVDGRRKLVFGLPGNPVSSLVTFYLMVVPAMRKMMGWPAPHVRRVQAHLAQPLQLDPVRPEYHRATLSWDPQLNEGRGGYRAFSTGNQASSRLLSMRSANALLELPCGEGELSGQVQAVVIGEL